MNTQLWDKVRHQPMLFLALFVIEEKRRYESTRNNVFFSNMNAFFLRKESSTYYKLHTTFSFSFQMLTPLFDT